LTALETVASDTARPRHTVGEGSLRHHRELQDGNRRHDARPFRLRWDRDHESV